MASAPSTSENSQGFRFVARKGRLYPTGEQVAQMTRMTFLLACIRERLKAESREYYQRNDKGCPADWLQKAIAQRMHRALGMPCDALSFGVLASSSRL